MASLPPIPAQTPSGPPPQAQADHTLFCWHCGTRLQLQPDFKGTGGPCPQCAAWLTVSAPAPPGAHTLPVATAVAAKAADAEAPAPADIRRPARLRPDLTVDFDQVERREVARTITMIGVILLTAGVCAAITFFLLQ